MECAGLSLRKEEVDDTCKDGMDGVFLFQYVICNLVNLHVRL